MLLWSFPSICFSNIFCLEINISNYKYVSKNIEVFGVDVKNEEKVRSILEDILKIRLDNIFNQYNVVLQNTIWRGHHRCEILGCHYNYFNKLFRFPSYNDMIEEEYTKRITKIGTILLLPKLKLHKKTMQGVGAYLEHL